MRKTHTNEEADLIAESIFKDYKQMLKNKRKWDNTESEFKEYIKSHIERFKSKFYPHTVVDVAKKHNVSTVYVYSILKKFKNEKKEN